MTQLVLLEVLDEPLVKFAPFVKSSLFLFPARHSLFVSVVSLCFFLVLGFSIKKCQEKKEKEKIFLLFLWEKIRTKKSQKKSFYVFVNKKGEISDKKKRERRKKGRLKRREKNY